MTEVERVITPDINQDLVSSPGTSMELGELTDNDKLPAERVAEVTGSAGSTPEMPASHLEIDAKAITIDGLIKACPYFAKIAERDPERAKSIATEAVQRQIEEAAMRASGASDADIKKQQWAAMRERHRQKMKTSENQDEKSISFHPDPVEERPVTEIRAIERVVNVDLTDKWQEEKVDINEDEMTIAKDVAILVEQARELNLLETAIDIKQKSLEDVFAQNKPVMPKPKKAVVKRVESELHRQHEEVNPVHTVLPTDHPVYMQHTDKAAQIVAPEETVMPSTVLKSPLDTVKAVSHIPLMEAPETKQTLGSAEQQSDVEQGVVERIVDQAVAEQVMHERFELTDSRSVTPSAALVTERIEPVAWTNELDKESLQIYKDFTEALRDLVTLPDKYPMPELEGELTIVDEDDLISNNEEIQESDAAHDIPITVVERLANLESEAQEMAAVIVADIFQTVHTIEMLNSAETIEVQTVERMQAKLEELVITLFDQIDIEYKPEDIEWFVALLLRPDFQLPQFEGTDQIAVDLEHDGTREAKIYLFSKTVGFVADVEHNLERLLGMLVLFRATVFQG